MLCDEVKSPLCRFSFAGLLGPGQAREGIAFVVQGERDLRSKLLVVTLCLGIHRKWVFPLLEDFLKATDRVFLYLPPFKYAVAIRPAGNPYFAI